MQNLEKLEAAEQIKFINSFDHVLFDMDGVIWVQYQAIPGAVTCVASLKKLGKKVCFVSNNDTASTETLFQYLKKNNFNDVNTEDIINPPKATIAYLKKNKFNKKVYVVSTNVFRGEIEKAGFDVVSLPIEPIEESITSVLDHIKDDKDIGGVILNYDVNITFLKLQKALTYLKRKECILLIGGRDKQLPIGPLGPLLGPHYFIQGIIDISERDFVQMAKPATDFNEILKEQFNITDPKRVLFIGDTIDEDMKFASNCGYTKLLVLTGVAKINHLNNWSHSDELKPHYYLEGLRNLDNIIKNVML